MCSACADVRGQCCCPRTPDLKQLRKTVQSTLKDTNQVHQITIAHAALRAHATNTVNSTLSLTKATPYSTRATEKIPAPLWPLRWCRPSSPTVKNQPSSLTVQPRPLHLSLRCFRPRPLMMKHRARRQYQHCLAHRLDAREASLDEEAHDLLAGLHPATPRVRSAASAAPAATRHCRRRVVGRGGRSLEARAARRGCFSCPVPNLAHFNTQPSTVAPPQSNGSRSDLAVWRRVRAPSAHRAISYETPASKFYRFI